VVSEAAGEVAGPAGAAALLVWAKAEIIEKAAMARKERRSLLVIGSLKTPWNMITGNLVPRNMIPEINSDLPFSGNAGEAHWAASITRRGCGRVVHPWSAFCNGVDRSHYREHDRAASNCLASRWRLSLNLFSQEDVIPKRAYFSRVRDLP